MAGIYQRMSRNSQLRDTLEQQFELSSDRDEKQRLAWRIADLYQKSGQIAYVERWYRQLIQLDSETQLAQLADLQLKLLNVGNQWRSKIDILTAARQRPALRDLATRQLTAELYRAWQDESQTQAKAQLGVSLEEHLRSLLQTDSQWPPAELSEQQIPLVVILVTLWESQVAEGRASDSKPQELLTILNTVYQWTMDRPDSASDQKPLGLTQLLLKALPYWDRKQEYAKILQVRSRLRLSELSELQQYHLLSYATRAMEATEPVSEELLISDLQYLVKLGDAGQLNLSDETQWPNRARLLAAFRKAGRFTAAKQWIGQQQIATPSLNYQTELARLYSEQGEAEAARPLWETVHSQLLAGSDGWLEAEYWLIQGLKLMDQDAAAERYERLEKLYPEIGEPWNSRLKALKLGTDQRPSEKVGGQSGNE